MTKRVVALLFLLLLAAMPFYVGVASATTTLPSTTYLTYPAYGTQYNYNTNTTLTSLYQEGGANATYPNYWFTTLLTGETYGLQSENVNFTVLVNFVSDTFSYLAGGAGTVKVYVGALGEPVTVTGATYTYDAVNSIASVTTTGAGVVIVSWAVTPTPTVTLTINQPTATTYTVDEILTDLSASGGTIDTIWFNVKNGTSWIYASDQVYTMPTWLTGYANGTYTLYAFANNTAGNSDSATVTFTVAIPASPPTPTNPTLTIVQPFNRTYTSGSIPVVIVSSGDAVWFNVMNGSSWVYTYNQSYTTALSKTGFTNGTYTLYAYAANSDGGFTSTSVVFTVGTPATEPSLPYVNMDSFWLFFNEGDFFGAFQALFISTFVSLDAAIALLVFLFMLPIYLRTRSLLLLCILWILIGGFLIAAFPLASGIAIIFVVLAVGGLIWRLFVNR